MPWPFSKRKEATESAASPSAPTSPPPITAADLAPPRLVVPVPRAWAALPPITRTVTTPSSTLVAPQASFVQDVAGTRVLIQAPVLRAVASDAPAGRADDIVATGRSLGPSTPGPGMANVPEGVGSHDLPLGARRAAAARPRSGPGRRLDAYEGELRPYERPEPAYADFEPEAWANEPVSADDEIPEELPPPIFSALLAERTGKSLAELRPDLADAEGNIIDPTPAAPSRTPGPRRRISPAELRRMGLGAPLHSDEAGQPGGQGDNAPIDTSARSTAPPTPPPAESVQADTEYVEEVFTFEEFVAAERGEARPEPLPDLEPPEPDLGPAPGPRRPSLRFRAAPGAPVRRLTTDTASTLRQTVPEDVRQAVHRATGVEPEPTVVHRGPEAAAGATQIGAAAFARDGEIFLPAEHGPLDGPATRAMLAHELTHVVQQRVYGGRLPRPDSPAGRRLESEARAVQRWVAGIDDAPKLKPLGTSGSKPPAPALGDELRGTADELVRTGLAHWAPDGTLVFGGGEMGGVGDPWGYVPGTIQEAVTEDHRLYGVYNDQYMMGTDTAQAQREYMEYHREFMERYSSQLETSVGGQATSTGTSAGLTSGGGGGGTVADIEKQLEEMKKADAPRLQTHGGFGGDPMTVALLQQHADDTEAWNKTVAEKKKKKDDLEKRKKELEKQEADHARAETEPGTTRGGEQPLRHAPVAGQTTQHPTGQTGEHPTGQTGEHPTGQTGGQIGGRTGGTAAPLTESQILTQRLADEKARFKLEEELLALEQAEVQAATPTVTGGGFLGMFGDPLVAQALADQENAKREAKQKKDENDRKKTHLESQLRQTRQIDAAKRREEAAKTREQDQTRRAQGQVERRQATADQTASLRTGTAQTPSPTEGPDEPGSFVEELADEDVEELANLLYSRLVTRLRRELIIDRERAGLLTDFR